MKIRVFLCSLFFAATLAQAFQVTDLRCEDLAAPVGVDLPQPKSSWQVEDATHTRGQKQTAYQILVALPRQASRRSVTCAARLRCSSG